MACSGQCYSHTACICNSKCGCNTDSKTCTGQRAASSTRVFAWTRTPTTSNTVTINDIAQLRTFLAQEQNARSTPTTTTGATYAHPGSCSVQTSAWTGTVSTTNTMLLTTFNQLVTLLVSLKTRANQQQAGVTATDPVAVTIQTKISLSHYNSMKNLLIDSYKKCICASKVNCACQSYCACQSKTTCSCNTGYCTCYGQCSCVDYNSGYGGCGYHSGGGSSGGCGAEIY